MPVSPHGRPAEWVGLSRWNEWASSAGRGGRHGSAYATETIRESYRAWNAEGSRVQAEGLPPEFRYIVEARVAQLRFAERLPAYRRFLVSADGYFWLEDYDTIEELSDPAWSWSERSVEESWTVLSPEGEWLGTVEIPSGVSLRAVAEDRVVGVKEDELDVQYIVVHELEKVRAPY
jgi:hypothetical protein